MTKLLNISFLSCLSYFLSIKKAISIAFHFFFGNMTGQVNPKNNGVVWIHQILILTLPPTQVTEAGWL